MFVVSDINRTGCFSIEFVKMSIREVSTEFYFMEVVVFIRNIFCFVGYGTKSVVMALTAFLEYTGTAGYFVDMLLFLQCS